MKLKYIYLALCVVGTVLPYSLFIPWLITNGLNIPLFVSQIFSSPIAAFGCGDVIISAVTLFVFIFADNRNNNVRYIWLPIVATLTVGVSLGLPLYLFLREIPKKT